jgi:hypothetical protein
MDTETEPVVLLDGILFCILASENWRHCVRESVKVGKPQKLPDRRARAVNK